MKSTNVRRLTESAVMIAVSTVLSVLPIVDMPLGGKLTLVSMLPVMLISYRHGAKWGFVVSLTYGIIQLLLGADNLSYATSWIAAVAIVFLDYIVAYGVLGFAGIFKGKLRHNQALEFSLGIVLACVLRFLCHFVTGVTVWADFTQQLPEIWLFSLRYNGLYMLPECVLSVIVGVILTSLFDITSPRLTAKIKKKN